MSDLGYSSKGRNFTHITADSVTTDALTASKVTPSFTAGVDTPATLLGSAESGQTILIAPVTAASTYTLPAPAAGLSYNFILAAPPTADVIIVTDGGAGVLAGGVISAAGGSDDASGMDTLTILDTALAGATLQLVSDGTLWFVSGLMVADGDITST